MDIISSFFFKGNIFSRNPIFAIGTFIGLFGIFATHRLLLYREGKKRIEESANEFRKVFNSALVEARDGQYSMGGMHINDDTFNIQYVTFLNFRHHLRGAYRKQYEKAWENYCYCLEHTSLGKILIRTTRVDIEKCIKHLLEFTKYSLWKNIEFYFRQKARDLRVIFGGPDEKTKEIEEKFFKSLHDENRSKDE